MPESTQASYATSISFLSWGSILCDGGMKRFQLRLGGQIAAPHWGAALPSLRGGRAKASPKQHKPKSRQGTPNFLFMPNSTSGTAAAGSGLAMIFAVLVDARADIL